MTWLAQVGDVWVDPDRVTAIYESDRRVPCEPREVACANSTIVLHHREEKGIGISMIDDDSEVFTAKATVEEAGAIVNDRRNVLS